MKRTITVKALAIALIVSSVGQSYGMKPAIPVDAGYRRYLPTPQLAAASFMATSIFLLATRSAKPDFQQKGTVRDILNVRMMLTHPKQYAANLKDVYMDHFVGQKGKEAGLQLGANNMVVNKEACKPAGVLGTIHSKISGHDETIRVMTMIGAMLAINKSDAILYYFGITKKPQANNPEEKRTADALEEQNRIAREDLKIKKFNLKKEFIRDNRQALAQEAADLYADAPVSASSSSASATV